jgi:hypothetical protein
MHQDVNFEKLRQRRKPNAKLRLIIQAENTLMGIPLSS